MKWVYPPPLSSLGGGGGVVSLAFFGLAARGSLFRFVLGGFWGGVPFRLGRWGGGGGGGSAPETKGLTAQQLDTMWVDGNASYEPPSKKSLSSLKPADIYLTRGDADNMYVQRNPTAQNYDSKE